MVETMVSNATNTSCHLQGGSTKTELSTEYQPGSSIEVKNNNANFTSKGLHGDGKKIKILTGVFVVLLIAGLLVGSFVTLAAEKIIPR